MDLLRISATAHGINYLPEYYAAAAGGFERRGLEVVSSYPLPWDGVIADPQSAASLRIAGARHIAHRLDTAGPMANSVYYTDRSRLDELHDRAVALMGGIAEAMEALSAVADPTGVIAREWPDGDHQALGEAAAMMAADGTWSSIAIEPDALARWVGFLYERGLAVEHAPFDELVDARVAAAVTVERSTRWA